VTPHSSQRLPALVDREAREERRGRFSPIVERITRANPTGANFWQHSPGKAAGDIVQSAADDLRFGDDPQEVADRTSAKLAAMEAA